MITRTELRQYIQKYLDNKGVTRINNRPIINTLQTFVTEHEKHFPYDETLQGNALVQLVDLIMQRAPVERRSDGTFPLGERIILKLIENKLKVLTLLYIQKKLTPISADIIRILENNHAIDNLFFNENMKQWVISLSELSFQRLLSILESAEGNVYFLDHSIQRRTRNPPPLPPIQAQDDSTYHYDQYHGLNYFQLFYLYYQKKHRHELHLSNQRALTPQAAQHLEAELQLHRGLLENFSPDLNIDKAIAEFRHLILTFKKLHCKTSSVRLLRELALNKNELLLLVQHPNKERLTRWLFILNEARPEMIAALEREPQYLSVIPQKKPREPGNINSGLGILRHYFGHLISLFTMLTPPFEHYPTAFHELSAYFRHRGQPLLNEAPSFQAYAELKPEQQLAVSLFFYRNNYVDLTDLILTHQLLPNVGNLDKLFRKIFATREMQILLAENPDKYFHRLYIAIKEALLYYQEDFPLNATPAQNDSLIIFIRHHLLTGKINRYCAYHFLNYSDLDSAFDENGLLFPAAKKQMEDELATPLIRSYAHQLTTIYHHYGQFLEQPKATQNEIAQTSPEPQTRETLTHSFTLFRQLPPHVLAKIAGWVDPAIIEPIAEKIALEHLHIKKQ